MFNRFCRPELHCHRRTLLGAGLLGAGFSGASMLTPIARALAAAEASGRIDPSRPRSVILLWMEGGPSQLETFDPHPGTSYGGDVGAIKTTAKGIQISDLLPQTATQMHLASLVRSVVGNEGEHHRAIYQVKTGYRPDPTLTHPSIGAILCEHDSQAFDLPRHVCILPGNSPGRGGYLGGKFDAFKVNDPAGPVTDVQRRVDPERYDARIGDLMDVVEKNFARGRLADLETARTLHRGSTDAALQMMSSEQLTAFDVTQESASELEAFGDTPFGRGCLAATRLIETGVRCVEVNLGGWDSHVTNHTLQSSACETLDPALASLLRRLEQRDLLSTTLVVCAGEFGRTPRINPAEGRDHWPHGFSVLMAGAGIRRGFVYGATASEPKLDPAHPKRDISDPVTVGDLHATILHVLGIDPAEELITPIGRPLARSEGQPIKPLLDSKVG
ncbi:DUF1501 domain-containing protein [Crateriforma conspicua]|uniref:DUF1501 domain-containing protein n=1 Tax=Crateriforma conspicua TaxID=2527996 RepID=A0A5C5XXP2_9PLAN|nr:DUF1501 domain-containing protein [Crateriforma conspicua]QDV63116.1 hypothetical protein Mal65_22570 [Crateriforma conspicua]TWT68117.1 hypothetical protein Pan14r_03560 [Crateriforma conspicua]